MSDFDDFDSQNWEPPLPEAQQSPPLQPQQKFWLFSISAALAAAEAGNWLLHTGNYSMANPVGSTTFLVDVFGLPAYPLIENLSMSQVLNSVLGLAAVTVPIVMWSLLLDNKTKVFGDAKNFFKDKFVRLVTGLLMLLYGLIIATEAAVLYMRIMDEVQTGGAIPTIGKQAELLPMVLMALAVIVINAGLGLATAHVSRSIKNTRKLS